jgi:hypothetical protein
MKTVFIFVTAALLAIAVYPLMGTTILIQEPEIVVNV